MNDILGFEEHLNVKKSKFGLNTQFNLKGKFVFEQFRRKEKIAEYEFHNDITNEGKNDILDVYFSDGTQTAAASWFIGLVDNAGFTAFAAADTMSSHGGWTEYTGYSNSTRVAWGPGNPAAQSITNATPATFNMNATGNVKGGFVTSNSTKGGTTGKLWATGAFSAVVPVQNGDDLKVTYTCSA